MWARWKTPEFVVMWGKCFIIIANKSHNSYTLHKLFLQRDRMGVEGGEEFARVNEEMEYVHVSLLT